MDFKNSYPEYAAIEQHIRRARAERSVAIAHFIVEGVMATLRGLRKARNAIAQLGAPAPNRGPAPSR